jgi:hypothetical protein
MTTYTAADVKRIQAKKRKKEGLERLGQQRGDPLLARKRREEKELEKLVSASSKVRSSEALKRKVAKEMGVRVAGRGR